MSISSFEILNLDTDMEKDDDDPDPDPDYCPKLLDNHPGM